MINRKFRNSAVNLGYDVLVDFQVETEGSSIACTIERPEEGLRGTCALVCHGLPRSEHERKDPSSRYDQVRSRIVSQVQISVVSANLTGTGESIGDFSVRTWMKDVASIASYLRDHYQIQRLCLVGFGLGGSIALDVAANRSSLGIEEILSGVVACSPRSHFRDWTDRKEQLVVQMRSLGLFANSDYPSDINEWLNDMVAMSPEQCVKRIGNLPTLLIHGDSDVVVPPEQSVGLADAIGDSAEIRIINGAGNMLRHDPRVVAVLMGWLEDNA